MPSTNRIQTVENALGPWVVRQRWWLLLAAILAVVGTGIGVRFLSFNNDTRVFFSEQNPQLQALEALENTYNKVSTVIFVIAPSDGDVFTRQTLAAVEELTEASWRIPYSSRVNALTNFQHTRAEEDELIVEDLAPEAGSLSEADLERIREIALAEPQLVNSLISPSGHVTGVSVNLLLPGASPEEVPEAALFARTLAGEFRSKHPDIDLYLTGTVMSDQAFGEVSRHDMVTLTPFMFLVLILIAGLALRSVTGTLATLLVILMSMITGMGLAGWARIALTSASAVAPTIILTLALADSVHILATTFQRMRRGHPKRESIAESLRINVRPVTITSVTTAIGFLTMNFSDAPPFRDLGNIVAMGVMAALVYSLFLLPALMAVLPVRVKPTTQAHHTLLDRLADFVIGRRNVVFGSMVVVILALVSGIPGIELNDQFIKYFSERYEIRTATDFGETHLTGADVIEYSLESGETGGISEPAYLATVEAFANWYRTQPRVVHVSAITNTMKRLNRDMHGGDTAYYRIPEQRDLAAQYLLLYEMSLPFGHDLNNQINVDKSATRMLVTVRSATTTALRALDESARQWLSANAPAHMFTYGSGLSIIWAHISERNINSMLGAAFGALVLISVILIFALRSLRLGLLSLIPNLAPALMAFGVWGLLVGEVGLGLSVIVSMTLGIVVDDTVHFMSKYLHARREHAMPPTGAVWYAFRTVGVAMWITTLALVVGFMILALSGYRMTADMGLMSAVTIALALVLDFLFLPTLLMIVDRKAEQSDDSWRSNSVLRYRYPEDRRPPTAFSANVH